MEKMNKPAWFELADNDQPASLSPKARKGGIFAVVTTLALTGVAGWGFISSEEFPATVASASSAVVEKVAGNFTSESNTVNSITAPTGYEDDYDVNDDDFRPTQSVAVASAAGVASSATVINPPSSVASSTGNNPILPPSGNSDDDDDDDDEDDDDHKGDRKKSREDHDDDYEDEDDD
ncbi:hypothetical protein GM50_4830 [freshwater metagenome]|uniref:Uncharacterized protein n=1 Tax=freshwater metagenome TaxID=449393 RepID=A0A094SM40_9ZZZZ